MKFAREGRRLIIEFEPTDIPPTVDVDQWLDASLLGLQCAFTNREIQGMLDGVSDKMRAKLQDSSEWRDFKERWEMP